MQDIKLKIASYVVLVIVLAVAGYYYYGYLQKRSAELDQSTQVTIAKNFANKKLETEVLKDKKFKELQKVVVEEGVLGRPTTEPGLSLEDIAKIPRRYSNPFKPF